MSRARRRRPPQTTLVHPHRSPQPCLLSACAIVSGSPVVLSRPSKRWNLSTTLHPCRRGGRRTLAGRWYFQDRASDGTCRRPCILADAEDEEEEDASLGRFLCLFYDRATAKDQWTRRRRPPQTTIVHPHRSPQPCMLSACAIVSGSPVVLSRPSKRLTAIGVERLTAIGVAGGKVRSAYIYIYIMYMHIRT
jgi:hypothetical protein